MDLFLNKTYFYIWFFLLGQGNAQNSWEFPLCGYYKGVVFIDWISQGWECNCTSFRPQLVKYHETQNAVFTSALPQISMVKKTPNCNIFMITKIYWCNANAHIYFQVLFVSSLTPLFRVISRSDTDEPADRGRRPFRRCPLTSGSFSGGQRHSRRHGTLPSPGHPVRVSAMEESQTRKRSNQH